jgi:hypothetical protein
MLLLCLQPYVCACIILLTEVRLRVIVIAGFPSTKRIRVHDTIARWLPTSSFLPVLLFPLTRPSSSGMVRRFLYMLTSGDVSHRP